MQAIPVPFADGEQVRNAYTGETNIVQNGQVPLSLNLHQGSRTK